ncbi:MAG: hypothetical protein LUD68_07150 [Rikenellaceae bacterium]|nr:hypothetical protein [Rikenellaceae bacterium]
MGLSSCKTQDSHSKHIDSISGYNRQEIEKIRNAVKNAVIQAYGNMIAACNIGVQNTFASLFGFNIFEGMKANAMMQHMSSSSAWTEISISEAQHYANQGYFVVAGWEILREEVVM